MSNMYFGVYRDDVMKLARSFVIKFDHIATAINDQLKAVGIETDPDEPTTWKYYKNLAGEYHETDIMMTVRSMDTLEIIDFTKESLTIHRATAREYYPGSVYYNNLVREFPDQASLITGILYPIDIETAINSHNGEILYYDPKYVDNNEDDFLPAMQDWVTVFYGTWYNDAFTLTDDLYLASFLGHLYGKIPVAIMLYQLRNAKTRRVGSFHLRQHLASNSRLDEFIPYLMKSQQLHLYRNVNWYERNVGKEKTWGRLVDKILTPRGIPLIWYNIKQNTEKMPEELSPTVDMVKLNQNWPVIQENLEKTTVGVVLEREDPLARDNPLVRFDMEKEIEEKVSSDQFSILPTKILDSEVIDRSTSSVRSLMSVLLAEWLDLSSRGKYRAYVQIPHPRTGELMTITVKDAFIMMLYCYMKVWEIPMGNIPTVVAYEVMRPRLPMQDELINMVDWNVVHMPTIHAIQDRITPMGDYISTEQFYLDCTRFHNEYLACWELYSFQEHYLGRAYCENVVKAHYMNRRCQLVDQPTDFESYFTNMGIDLKDLRQSEYEQLVNDTINIATGSNLYKIITLGEIQRELLRLMGRMSSYPLQYLRNVAFTNFHVIGTVAVRLGDYKADAASYANINIGVINVMSYRSSAEHYIPIYDKDVIPGINYTYDQTLERKIDPTVTIKDLTDASSNTRVNIPIVGIRAVTFTYDETPPADGTLDGYLNSDDSTWPAVE
jgi:hypothetical protein